jgi:alkylated DNA repair dioxygenase AlkB
MQLFNTPTANINILPYDGIVHYYGRILQQDQASAYMQRLLHTIAWKNDEVIIFGKRHITKRKTAWYADGAYPYTYSNTTKEALPWTTDLAALKNLAEEYSGATYNACLLNLYHHGDEGMSWHSDNEKSIHQDSAIASISLGAERKFSLRHKTTRESTSIMLEHGSLLVMKGSTQTHWQHSLPKSKKVQLPRINLTFRNMIV